MTVILLILKIIGIILLILLGLLVFLILAAVFYPVGYRITGSFEEEKEFQIRLHWLFYLACFRFRMMQEEQRAVLYILGIPKQIYPVIEKKEKHRRKQKRSGKTHIEEMADADTRVDEEEELSPTMQITSISGEEKAALSENALEGPEQTIALVQSRIEIPKQRSLIRRMLKKVKDKIQKIKYFFRVLPDKFKALYSNFAEWKRILTDETNKASVKLIWGEIKYLAFHYKPKRLKADICYGLGDPALTGKSLAILSMIPFLYRKKVQIVPDFETEKLFVKGNLDARGHIRLFHLIRSGLHIWKDDNCRKLIRKLRQ